ncbi:PEP-CTERM sorting domain-containing protein [Botrimarina sp.]|uniref:PEP-CTERM sorting domain-containing protein n=1 Tax=Botrimarina sp. TaxID=2795802 RepID=UPI0032EF7581
MDTLLMTFTSTHLSLAASLSLTLLVGDASGQAKIFDWSGASSSDWSTAANWTVVEDPIGTPVGAPASAAPDADTDVGIATVAGFPVFSSGAQQAYIVKVGGSAGPGRLDVTGGSLETENDLDIGFDDTGTLNINDSNGPVSIIIGDDLNVDRDAPAYNSTVVISGDVSIEVNDQVELGAQGPQISDFLFDFQSGTLRAGDNIRVRGGAAAQMRVSGGLVEAADELDVDSLLAISGDGIVRALRLTSVSSFAGVVTIDNQGLLQIATNNDTPLTQIQDYIDSGVFSTSGPGLVVSTVSVSDFFGSDRDFYQVSVVPEPGTGLMLLTMVSAGFYARQRAAR